MQRFKNILALYDHNVGDEAVFERAAALAKKYEAKLTVVDIIERVPSDTPTLLGPLIGNEPDAQRRFVEERQSHLERLIASIKQEGVRVRACVLLGKPYQEVIRAVLREGYDLVVIAANNLWGQNQITFGGAPLHLVRKCPCPIWVMRPRTEHRLQGILAAVDLSVTQEASGALDLKILELASSLAQMEECHLDVLCVWNTSGAGLDGSRFEFSDQMMQQLIERSGSIQRRSLPRLFEHIELDGVKFEVHLLKGDPARVVPRMARHKSIDLIVMGTLWRTGMASFFTTDTAEQILRQVDCSTLTVKPDRFAKKPNFERFTTNWLSGGMHEIQALT